ncbi:receptor-type tyrosine-protein phosphatase mu-like [Lytechinus variegatus]|uniref:receptor-type tyrosine-protein phosphatase mu-like n=1 Tax=Lytechinus variegatus TaxID=7654 RepID=UPI001BB1DB92|nr:receptor-type tyrosine-protein phosphatase mu-like [Lytechinus variegatus]
MFVCIIYDVNNYRSDIIHADLNILPQLKRAPLIQETTQTSITLTWDEWMAREDIGDPPLIGYNVYYKEEALDSLPWIQFDRENDTEAAERADGLDPDTDYIFAVSAVREGQGGEGPLKKASASTKCLPPTGVVSHVTAHQVSSPDELLITWQLPTSGANCRSGMANISIYFSTVNHVSLVESVKIPFSDTTETHYLDSVLPDTQYAIYITLWNKDAEGPSSQSSLRMTSQRQTSAVPWVTFGVTLALLLASLGTIIFLWRRLKTNPATPKANKTIQEQPPYENPTFEESLIHTYESTIRMDPTTDIDYINVK